MLNVSNVKVYDLEESIISSRNAMRVKLPEYTEEEFNESLNRAIKLANTQSGSGHSNFLKGVRVSFDLIYPNYFSPQLQRYNWIDIISSSSKMHRLDAHISNNCFNEYVDERIIDIIRELSDKWSKTKDKKDFMRLISNCPQGLELFMRISTNYLQLKTIYHQRKNHKLEDWDIFCKFIEELPYAQEFIIIK